MVYGDILLPTGELLLRILLRPTTSALHLYNILTVTNILYC